MRFVVKSRISLKKCRKGIYIRDHERTRFVAFEGSRTNINIAKDEFQDYDITYLDSDLDSFIASDEWLRQFDHLIMLQ